MLVNLLDDVSCNGFSCTFSSDFFELVERRMEHFKNQVPEIKSRNSIHSQTRIQRISLN